MLKLAKRGDKLPARAQESIAGTTEPEDAWRLLDKQYGNKTVAIMLAIQRIEIRSLAPGPDHDKSEAVHCSAEARMHRRALGAEHQLFGNSLNIKRLVEKLERTAQTRWFYYQAEHPD